jgi:hypothetical protein
LSREEIEKYLEKLKAAEGNAPAGPGKNVTLHMVRGKEPPVAQGYLQNEK